MLDGEVITSRRVAARLSTAIGGQTALLRNGWSDLPNPGPGTVPRAGRCGARCYTTATYGRSSGSGKIAIMPSDLVGVAGFEPTAPRSQSECATKLRHTPSARV